MPSSAALDLARALLPLVAGLIAVSAVALSPPSEAGTKRAGRLDNWRFALAIVAIVARVVAFVLRGGDLATFLCGAGGAFLCAVAAYVEARTGRREHSATRVAWLVVAGAAVWEALRKTTYPAAAWAALAAAAALAYVLVNAGARRGVLKTGDGYALLDEEDESPEDAAGPFSTGVFAWMSPLLALGYERPLESSDLFPLARDDDPDNVAQKLRAELGKRPSPDTGLLGALCSAFGGTFLVGGVYKLVYDTTQLAVPLLLSAFLKKLGKDEAMAYKLAGAMVLNAVVATLLLHQYFQRTYRTGMRLKSAAISLVFDKALCARKEGARAEDEEAQDDKKNALVTNLMSVDAQRLQDNMTYLFTVVSGVYQIIVTLYLLYQQLGIAFLGGLVTMLLFMPVTQRIVLVQRNYQKVVLRNKDRRIKLQAEALGGMKIIKLYGWEDPLGAELKRLRELELAALWQYKLAGVVSRCVFSVVPTVVAVATFSLYMNIPGNELDVSLVYTTLALFNVLRFPLMMVPRAIGGAVEGKLSVDRLGGFLASPEVAPLPPLEESRVENPLRKGDAVISFEGCDLRWPAAADGAPGPALLRGVDVAVRQGSLMMVLGETGSGKSGLLAALLGECEVAAGAVSITGSVAYAAQTAWIQNATVRDNILFGAPMDRARYAETVRRCALTADLEALADGDRTEIGEKGLTLSGGQKQRVALARAYYARADVYLLDDCLSAVDAHVAQHLFDHLVAHLRDDLGKTVVLVTHNLSAVKRCDAVLALGTGGAVDYCGPPEGFLDLGRTAPDAHPLAALAVQRNAKRSTSSDALAASAEEARAKEESLIAADKKAALARGASQAEATVRLTAAEHRTRGVVKAETRLAYLAATGGPLMALLVVVAQVAYQGATVVTSWWLGFWAAHDGERFIGLTLNKDVGLIFYVSISIAAVLLSVLSYAVCSLLGQNAARALHNRMLDGLLKAPMAFFDRTPLGRLVNLFSKDLYTIDEELPVTLAMWLSVGTSCVATVVTIAIATPWFMALALPLGILYYGIMGYFIPSVRELKRLDATSRSPVFSAFAEALDGASTIRAFRAEARFSADQSTKLRTNLKAYFLGTACNRWLAVRLEMIGTLTTGAAAFLAVLADTPPYLAGLSLTYALSVTQALNWFVRMNADLENNSVAVERVVDQAGVREERDGPEAAPGSWPSAGAIKVESLSLRYRPELPLVLKGLTFEVAGGTKLALVGRTGSGKSSFLLALLRLAPPAPGSRVLVDGVDVLACRLADLRRRVSMIPQDPVLFSGTVRFNVDPFGASTDAEVERALADAQLGGRAALDAPVEEGGRNFSLGERQLLCLARAILRRSRLLLLDEATSAVDEALDEAVQKAIRTTFADATVVCIAHRINTIADYDRVLVLDDGNVVEDGNPAALAQNPDSKYARLAAASDEGV